MKTPSVIKAFEHVRGLYPTVKTVYFNQQLQWLYKDGEGKPLKFGDEVDVNILQDAADSLVKYPAKFTI